MYGLRLSLKGTGQCNNGVIIYDSTIFSLLIIRIYVIFIQISEGGFLAGEILKKRREDLGLSVQEIAEALKIRKDYLAAIEEDAFGKLPVPVYTVGYIRAYAKYLDVDSDPIVEFYNKHLSQPESAAIMPIAFSRKKFPAVYVVIAVIVILALFVALLLFFGRRSSKQTGLPAGQSPVQQQAGPTGASQEATPPAVLPETKEHNLEITAAETTWLSIKFSNGKTDEALLRPDDSKTWTFAGRATLKIGNAGGIDMKFDGEDLGTPGDPGEVKTLTLPGNPENESTSP
jgi:cytoskeleton protein RodZ